MIKLQEKYNNNTKWTLRTTRVDDSLHLDLYLHQICFVSLLMRTALHEKNQDGDKRGCDSSSFIYILIFLIQCCTHARNSKTDLKRGLTCLNYKKKCNNNTKQTLCTTRVDDSLHLDLYLLQTKCFVSLLMRTTLDEKNQDRDK